MKNNKDRRPPGRHRHGPGNLARQTSEKSLGADSRRAKRGQGTRQATDDSVRTKKRPKAPATKGTGLKQLTARKGEAAPMIDRASGVQAPEEVAARHRAMRKGGGHGGDAFYRDGEYGSGQRTEFDFSKLVATQAQIDAWESTQEVIRRRLDGLRLSGLAGRARHALKRKSTKKTIAVENETDAAVPDRAMSSEARQMKRSRKARPAAQPQTVSAEVVSRKTPPPVPATIPDQEPLARRLPVKRALEEATTADPHAPKRSTRSRTPMDDGRADHSAHPAQAVGACSGARSDCKRTNPRRAVVTLRMSVRDFLRMKLGAAVLKKRETDLLMEALDYYLDAHGVESFDDCLCLRRTAQRIAAARDDDLS